MSLSDNIVIVKDTNRPVLLFDGECNLCNRTVQFIIRYDKKKIFLFAPLQSAAGKDALLQFPGTAPDSVILFYKEKYFIRSTAALQTLRLIGGFWGLLYIFILVPRFLRDRVYDIISRNRYKWFGKRNECMIPTKELAGRFL